MPPSRHVVAATVRFVYRLRGSAFAVEARPHGAWLEPRPRALSAERRRKPPLSAASLAPPLVSLLAAQFHKSARRERSPAQSQAVRVQGSNSDAHHLQPRSSPAAPRDAAAPLLAAPPPLLAAPPPPLPATLNQGQFLGSGWEALATTKKGDPDNETHFHIMDVRVRSSPFPMHALRYSVHFLCESSQFVFFS